MRYSPNIGWVDGLKISFVGLPEEIADRKISFDTVIDGAEKSFTVTKIQDYNDFLKIAQGRALRETEGRAETNDAG